MKPRPGINFSLLLTFLLLAIASNTAARNTPPPVVTVMTVTEEEINPSKTYVGRVEAIQAVDLQARVQGYLEEVKFKEGAEVNAGDILYVIEQAPYKARVDEENARVAEARASLKDARQYLQRLKAVQSGGVSETDLETAANKELRAEAALEEAKANLREAQIDLGYTTIKAPIAGRIGKTTLTKGNLVGPASGSLARIVQLHPIRVVYSISENHLAEMGRNSNPDSDTETNPCPPVPMIRMPNGEMYPLRGRLDFVDNQVDPDTGTIAVRAIFDNPKGFLLPGQYVTIMVSCKAGKRLPLVPQSAVQVDRKGRYVFVVDDRMRVQERRIQTGVAMGTHWAVHSGLTAGERVIIQGVQKVSPGQTVKTVTEAEKIGD